MKLFGLMAFGTSELYGGRLQLPSRNMHPTREAAQAELPDFKRRVTEAHDTDLDCIEETSLEIEVFEYELADDVVSAES